MLRPASLARLSLLGLGAVATVTLLASAPAPAKASVSPGSGMTRRFRSSRPAASPELFQRFVDAEQRELLPPEGLREAFPPVPMPPTVGAPPPPLDAVDAKHDVTLDPMTGAVTGTLDLTVQATGKALGSIALSIDKGLTASSVSATGRTATMSASIYGMDNVISVTFSPALPAGTSTVVHLVYGGTLACEATNGRARCSKGQAFNYFAHGSVIPFIYDPSDSGNGAYDGITRTLTVKTAQANSLFVTGERESDTVANGTRTTVWSHEKPIARHLGLYIIAGQPGTKDITGRTAPTTLLFKAPSQPVDDRLASWTVPVLDFIEKTAGSPLPFPKSQTEVVLPKELGDPGTATYGMTLLSDLYEQSGEVLHRETWCHENSHMFWGIVAPDMDPNQSRFLSEGLAVLTQIDFTHDVEYASEDRETYLERRYRAIGLDIRKNGAKVPGIVMPQGKNINSALGTPLWTLWAYYKTSSTLDHLRATIGDDKFAKGLATYVTTCSFVGCTLDDFRTIMEEASGVTLSSFFTRWVFGDETTDLHVGFTPTATGADVTLTKADDQPMRVELVVTLEDGSSSRTYADLAGTSTTVKVGTNGPVRSVALNPRHDVRIASKSATDGDLDFDGESDGLDILRCARQLGSTYDGGGGSGLWTLDETFDPRCDVDGNFTIDDADLAALSETYGTLRAR